MSRRALTSLIVGLVGCWIHTAHAATTIYALAIGHNGAPSGAAANETPLNYADDDAVAFYEFTRGFARESHLLTVMDADTQARFPHDVADARMPTLAELREQVRRLRQLMNEDRARGNESTVLFFYSGHGARPAGGPPALTLLDGSLTHDVLYDEVLSALPARYIHLFIDACYAEAVVRPRDADAKAVDLVDSDFSKYVARNTLARFPNVGAIVAASTSSQSHEWDIFRHGVFTHELLSGLRGGADVNFDGRIEYSELHAFIASANRDVPDSRARLSVVSRPPAADARTAIVNLNDLKSAGRIVEIPASAGQVYLEDQFGNRLADVRAETGAQIALTLPSDLPMFLRCRTGEAELTLQEGETRAFGKVRLGPPASRMRGALDSALRKGLYTTGFGPNYYRGFIDQASQFVSVRFPDPDATSVGVGPPDVTGKESIRSSPRSRALYVGAGVTEPVARGLGMMASARIGLTPEATDGVTFGIEGGWGHFSDVSTGQTGAGSGLVEGRVLGGGGYRLGVTSRYITAFAEGRAGIGAAWQSVSGQAGNHDVAWTAAFYAAPVFGIWIPVHDRIAIGSEAELSLLLHRRDNAFAVSPLPVANIGLHLGL
jgi:hypothetical protein